MGIRQMAAVGTRLPVSRVVAFVFFLFQSPGPVWHKWNVATVHTLGIDIDRDYRSRYRGLVPDFACPGDTPYVDGSSADAEERSHGTPCARAGWTRTKRQRRVRKTSRGGTEPGRVGKTDARLQQMLFATKTVSDNERNCHRNKR